ncbi:MAG TPA: hypothetical protein VFV72_04945 [Candidatus Limnocylindrales bacterium]|nr:hypothetical protein [Candidatus Limnocylindrales bacterium]
MSEERLPQGSQIWLGDSEGTPPHWGGVPRTAEVLGRRRLPAGAGGILVRLEPPLPRTNGEPLSVAILMGRSSSDRFDALSERPIVVNVLAPAAGVDIAKNEFADGELIIQYCPDAAATPDVLPKPIDEAAFWAETLNRIREYIETHGDSRVPAHYADARGRLDVIVENLRWHHAGHGGVSPGPFPGIDYAADLDRLPGWEW